MEYKVIYSGETKDINDVHTISLEIYKYTDEEVTVKELTLGGDSPIVIEYDGNGEVFKPLIQSTCTVKAVTDEPLLDLYTGQLNEICIKVYQDGELFWYGFLTPNIYSSDYEIGPNEFEIEFIDVIAHLENVKFEQYGFYKSFLTYFDDAIGRIDLLRVITGYVNQEDGINLKTMGVMQRNFIDETNDEDNGAMSCKELFESLMGWMGKSMIQYKDKLYLIDLTTYKINDFGFYKRYTGEKSYFEMDKSLRAIHEIGVNDASAGISYGSVYNKATVIANTNTIENTIPDLFDDEKMHKVMPENEDYIERYYLSNKIKNGAEQKDAEYMMFNAFFLNDDWYLPRQTITGVYPPGTTDILGNDISGQEYEFTLGGPDMEFSSLYLKPDGTYDLNWQNPHPGLVSKDNIGQLTAYNGIQRYADYKIFDGEPSQLKWNTVATMMYTGFRLSFNLYYDYYDREPYVNDWHNYIQVLKKPHFIGQGGYLILSMEYMFSNCGVYANTTPFNFTSETYGEVLPYASTSRDAWWRNDEFKVILGVGNHFFNGKEWVVHNQYDLYNEYPYFIVTHRNNRGDKIFGVTKSIDNTVSYKWNLASPEDGYAIKLPEDEPICGPLTFIVYADKRLGGTAQMPHHSIIQHWGDASAFHQFDGTIQNASPILAIHISKLSLVYTTKDTVKDVYNLEQYDPDIKYTNVINDKYVAELDDIELTTNTYNPHATSYSYVLHHPTSAETDYEFVREIDGKMQEHRILEKYVDYYSVPRLQYTNGLNNKDIKPWSRLRVNSLKKEFICNSVNYDLQNDRATVTAIEL